MNESTGYLKIILGSMFAGKTSELVSTYRKYTAKNTKPLVINHSHDTRYSNNKMVTHDGVSIDAVFSDNLKVFTDDEYTDKYDVYLINEGQFFGDLVESVDILLNKKKKKVYVCGLDGDFERKKFGTILDIIPWCDDIVKLKARCNHCERKGIFTMRLMNKTDNKDQILVGETNLYHSTCRRCYEKKYLNI